MGIGKSILLYLKSLLWREVNWLENSEGLHAGVLEDSDADRCCASGAEQ